MKVEARSSRFGCSGPDRVIAPVRASGDRATQAGILDGSDAALLAEGYLPIVPFPVFAATSECVQNFNGGLPTRIRLADRTRPRARTVTGVEYTHHKPIRLSKYSR